MTSAKKRKKKSINLLTYGKYLTGGFLTLHSERSRDLRIF